MESTVSDNDRDRSDQAPGNPKNRPPGSFPAASTAQQLLQKRGRGRPRKHPPAAAEIQDAGPRRGRGRPKGSKNKPKLGPILQQPDLASSPHAESHYLRSLRHPASGRKNEPIHISSASGSTSGEDENIPKRPRKGRKLDAANTRWTG